jgi:hypothetical protein
MRLQELELDEDAVMSSWIADLEYIHGRGARMTLNNNRAYIVDNMTQEQFDYWFNAGSKGQHWHNWIRGQFNVTRIA